METETTIETQLETDLQEAVAPSKENDPNEIFSRQIDFIKPEVLDKYTVTIIGCGSVGGTVALMLLKTGFTKFNLVDFDTVSIHNLSNQLHPRDLVGKKKTDSVEALLKFQAPSKNLHIWKYSDIKDVSLTEDYNVITFCVDTMEARRKIYDMLKNETGYFSYENNVLLDTRVGGFKYNVYMPFCKGMQHLSEYEITLKGDADPLPCHAKSYMISSVLVASLGCQLIFDAVRGGIPQATGDWCVFGAVNNGNTTLMTNSAGRLTGASQGPITVSAANW